MNKLSLLIFISISLILFSSFSSAITVTASNNSVGIIRSDFYGVSLSSSYFGNITSNKIDTNNDGSADAPINDTWHKNMWTNAGLGLIRYTINFHPYYKNTTDADGVNLTEIDNDYNAKIIAANWSYNHNTTVLAQVFNIPTWLMDNSTGSCISATTGNCIPSNYTKWANIINDFYQRLTVNETQNNIILELKNEPEGSWNATTYALFYNNTKQALLIKNPNIKIGGSSNYYEGYSSFLNTFLTTVSNNDFVTFHSYPSKYNNNLIKRELDAIIGNATTANVSWIIMSEGNVGNDTLKNTSALSNEYGSNIAQAYIDGLNYLDRIRFSFIGFQFAQYYHYGVHDIFYPDNYDYVSEPRLDNATYPPYNITKSFANNHKAGNTVYNSTSSDSGVKVVVSKDSDQTFITLINTNATAQTVNLNLNAIGTIGYLKDYDTNQVYNLNTPITLQSNDVKTMYEVLGSSSGNAITISNSPSGDITIADHDVEINSTINSENQIDTVQSCLNGVCTNIFDQNTIYCGNYNNISNIGENQTYLVDWCGNNNATYNGTFQNGKWNDSLNLSQVNLFGNTTSDFIGTTLNFSTCAWINAVGYGENTFGRIFDNGNTGLSISNANGGVLQFKRNGTTVSSASSSILLNTWYYVCAVSNSNNVSNIYINGLLSGTANQNTGMPLAGTSTVHIGNSPAKNRGFNGSIDELFMWNRSLSATEISTFYLYSLKKTNATSYNLYNINISNMTSLSNTYTIFTNDSLSNNNSATTNIYRKQVITLTSNFFKILLPNTYGTGMNYNFLSATTIDTNNDGNRETTSNLSWHREKFLDAFEVERKQASLESLYSNQTVRTDGVNFTGNVTTTINEVQWAYENDIKYYLIIDYMPTWLADNSSGNCNNLNYCIPSNYTIWENIIKDYIYRITTNGTYNATIEVEVWNEPDGNFLLTRLAQDHINKSIAYNLIYNATYRAVKSVYPNMPVFGPSLGSSSSTDVNMLSGFISNFSNQMNGVSLHRYSNTPFESLVSLINETRYYCNLYSANCSRIIISEHNILSSAIKNATDDSQYTSLTAQQYMILATLNENITMLSYEWSVPYKYENTASYPEYPNRWSMVSEPLLDNALYAGYNVAYLFKRYCPSGWSVYNTSNDYSTGIVQVYCTDGTNKGLITTNIENNQQNITVNGFSSNELLIDVNTKQLYNANSSGSLSYGMIDNYSVTSLTNPKFVNDGEDWVIQNYLGETLRPMTQSEIDNPAYLAPNEVVTTETQNNGISALGGIIKGLGFIAFVIIMGVVIFIVKGSLDGNVGEIAENGTFGLLLNILLWVVVAVLVVVLVVALV